MLRSTRIYHNTEAMILHVPPVSSYAPEDPLRIVAIEAELKGIPFRDAKRLLERDEGSAWMSKEMEAQPGSLWLSCETVRVSHMIHMDDLNTMYGEMMYRIQKSIPKVASTYDPQNGDIFWSPESLTAARVAATAAVEATLDAVTGKTQTAFCIVRPPGHHCFNVPEGFCVLNNVAVATRLALKEGKRVAIIDWDYHFGDGTALEFMEDPEVMFVSFHCKTSGGMPTYPTNNKDDFKGDGLAKQTKGRMWNIQWHSDDANDAAMKYAFEEGLLPSLRTFQPDVVLISAGFDAVKGDDLAGMELTPAVFGYMADAIASTGIPTVAVLEGGYNPQLLGKCCAETVKGLKGEPSNMEWPALKPHHKQVVDNVCQSLKEFGAL